MCLGQTCNYRLEASKVTDREFRSRKYYLEYIQITNKKIEYIE